MRRHIPTITLLIQLRRICVKTPFAAPPFEDARVHGLRKFATIVRK